MSDTESTFGDWDWSPQDGPPGHCIQAQVWDSNGDSIVAVDSTDGEEVANARARLIAAAGRAAHELPDEYDLVAAVEALPDILDVCEFPENDAFDLPRYFGHVARQLPEGDHNREMMEMLANRLSNALQKARDDE